MRSLHEVFAGVRGPFHNEFQSILKNPDPVFRWEEMIQLGLRLKQAEHYELASQVLAIAAQAAPEPSQRKVAKSELAAMSGSGSFGLRAEFLMSRFLGEATDPKLIVPMLAGTFMGRLAGTVVTGKMAQAAPSLLTRGLGARAGVAGVSFLTELPVFAGMQWAMMGASHPLEEHLARAGLTLGTIKVAGWGGARAFDRTVGRMSLSPSVYSGLRGFAGQAGIFGGLLASHRMETALGWRPATDGATTVTDTLAAMVSLSVGANLGGRALGGRFSRLQSEMAARMEQGLNRGNISLSSSYSGKIGEWLFGLQPAWAHGPIPSGPRELMPRDWFVSQMSALPEGRPGPNNGGSKGSSKALVRQTENPADPFPQKSLMEKPQLVRDAMAVGLKTLFSIDILERNLKPFVMWSGISLGITMLGYPLVGGVLWGLSLAGLIGGHVAGEVSGFLALGAEARAQGRIHLSLNRGAAKIGTEADPVFQERVRQAAQDVGWSENLLLARQLKNQPTSVIRETLGKYFGRNLFAKLSMIRQAGLHQGTELFVEALELKGLSSETYAWLLEGLGELGGRKALETLGHWAGGKARNKNPRVRLAAAKALIETDHVALAHQVLENLAEPPPMTGKKAFLREVHLALALAKAKLGHSREDQRYHLIRYWDGREVDFASMRAVRKMEDRELFEMIFDQKARVRQQDALKELAEKDRRLYVEIQKLDPDNPQIREEGEEIPEKHPQQELAERFPELYEAIFYERAIYRNPAWASLAKFIWNPERHPDPRVTAEAIGVLQNFLKEWGPIKEDLLKIWDRWLEKGTPLTPEEAILARKLLEDPIGSTAAVHKARKLIDKGGHSPLALIELGWAMAERGAKNDAKEIAEGLIKIPETAFEAGRLMDHLEPGWDGLE